MTEIFFERHYITISFNSKSGIGKAVWRGFLSTEEFREASQKCLELIKEHGIRFWIGDNRKMKAIRQHDQDWFNSVMLPELLKSSLEKMATLVSEDIFNKMAVENMFSKAAPVLTFENRYFNTEILAVGWLLSNKITPGIHPESQTELTEPELT